MPEQQSDVSMTQAGSHLIHGFIGLLGACAGGVPEPAHRLQRNLLLAALLGQQVPQPPLQPLVVALAPLDLVLRLRKYAAYLPVRSARSRAKSEKV